MKILRGILAEFRKDQPEAVYTFIALSASLIFGIFAWRQRLLLFPLSFSPFSLILF